MKIDVEELIERIDKEIKKTKELKFKYEKGDSITSTYHVYGELEAYNKVLNIIQEMIE